MNFTSFFSTLFTTIKPVAAAVAGAAASGAIAYIQQGGNPQDYKQIGGAAATGAVVALTALYVKPPATPVVPNSPVVNPTISVPPVLPPKI